jgi:hypothetical protein
MNIALGKQQMTALMILAVLTVMVFAFTVFCTVEHINVLHLFQSYILLPMSSYGGH